MPSNEPLPWQAAADELRQTIRDHEKHKAFEILGRILEDHIADQKRRGVPVRVDRSLLDKIEGFAATLPPDPQRQILEAFHEARAKSSASRPKKTRRPSERVKILTGKQRLAFELSIEHNGDIRRVADTMGVTRETAAEHLRKARQKLAKTHSPARRGPKTQAMPTDLRGQSLLENREGQ